MKRRIAVGICGTKGVPATYGGFETLAHQLATQFSEEPYTDLVDLTVYCESSIRPSSGTPLEFKEARLVYVPLPANGGWSLIYDATSLIHSAVLARHNVCVLLGVSGALMIPVLRLITKTKFVVNLDGIESRREKWGLAARLTLKILEYLAVQSADVLISDNTEIQKIVSEKYSKSSVMIPYGGDHVTALDRSRPPRSSKRAVCLCRVEPENNIAMILSAFSKQRNWSLSFIGNWNDSDHGRKLRAIYGKFSNIKLHDPIYDQSELAIFRHDCDLYVHGHSAGGTNPSLVEMMHAGLPVLAFNCSFNRATTENRAIYFDDEEDLINLLNSISAAWLRDCGLAMKKVARERYVWKNIARDYFKVFSDVASDCA